MPGISELGPYQITGELGRGGMGTVYRARHRQLGVERAVKVLRAPSAQARDRLEREAHALAAIQDPHVVRVHEIGHSDGQLWFSMELLEGEPLDARLERGRLDLDPALAIAAGITQGLAALHRAGIVHRDLKPANVFLTRDGRALILDLGLALREDEDQRLTQPGAVVGTVLYMAPEQIAGQRTRCGPATDVFALGLILYELLTGAPARDFDPGLGMGVLAGVLESHDLSPAARDPELPAALDDLVRRATRLDPGQRYPDAGALLAALEPLREQPGPSAGARRRRRLALSGLCALALVLSSAWLAARAAAPTRVAPTRGRTASPPTSPTGRASPAPPTNALDRLRELAAAGAYEPLLDASLAARDDPQAPAEARAEAEALFWRASRALCWRFEVPGDHPRIAWRGDPARLAMAYTNGQGDVEVVCLERAGHRLREVEPRWRLADAQEYELAAGPGVIALVNGDKLYVLRVADRTQGTRVFPERIVAVACSPDGETVALGVSTQGSGFSHVIRVRDTGENAGSCGPFEAPLGFVAYEDAERVTLLTQAEIASQQGPDSLVSWSLRTGKAEVRAADLHAPRALAVAGPLAAIGTSIGGVQVHRPGAPPLHLKSLSSQPPGTGSLQLRAHFGAIRSAAWLPDGRLLTSALDKDRSELRVWDPAGRELGSLLLDGGRLDALLVAPDGSCLLLAFKGGRVEGWPLRAP